MQRAPRPVPGTRELREVEATAHQAERDLEEAREELAALEPRLAMPVDVVAVKAGIAETPLEPPSDSPPRAPARGLKALFAGPRS